MIHNNLPEKLIVSKKNILDKNELAIEFNNLFVKISPRLATEKMQTSRYYFESFINSRNTKLPVQTVDK